MAYNGAISGSYAAGPGGYGAATFTPMAKGGPGGPGAYYSATGGVGYSDIESGGQALFPGITAADQARLGPRDVAKEWVAVGAMNVRHWKVLSMCGMRGCAQNILLAEILEMLNTAVRLPRRR